MAAQLIFELVDGTMVPRFSGEADGRRFFNLAQAARREKKPQRILRTLHLQVFAPFVKVKDEGDPLNAAPLAASTGKHTEASLAILHRYKFPNLGDDEFAFLVEQCRQWGLSPWSRHVFTKYEWDYGDVVGDGERHGPDEDKAAEAAEGAQAKRRDGQRLRVLTTIDGLRAAAGAAGRIVGNKSNPIPADKRIPFSVEYTVVKEEDGRDVPVTAEARWDEFYPADGDTDFWDRMPVHMLEKCAEAKCLRRAFPQALGDLYTIDEWRKRNVERRDRLCGRDRLPPRPAATLPGEDPVVDDVNRPQTPMKFYLQLQELGFKTAEQWNKLTGQFELEWPGLAEQDRADFYARTLAAIRRHPDRYGAKLSG